MKHWYKFQNSSNSSSPKKSAKLEIFDAIGGWWGVNALKFRSDLNALGDLDELSIHINSPGGSVMDGLGIYHTLKRHSAKKTVYVDGTAASIASIIAMAGDEIIVPKDALMMIHNPSTVTWGEEGDHEQALNALREIKTALVNAYVERTGRTVEEISAWMDAETWMTGELAVERGFATAVSEPINAEAKIVNFLKDTNFTNLPSHLKAVAVATDVPPPPVTPPVADERKPAPVITREKLAAEAPELLNSLLAEGAEAERKRIQDIEDLAQNRTDEFIVQAKYDGKTTAEALALKIVKHDNSLREMQAEAHKTNALRPLNLSRTEDEQLDKNADSSSIKAKAHANETLEQRAEREFKESPEIQAQFDSAKQYFFALKYDPTRKGA